LYFAADFPALINPAQKLVYLVFLVIGNFSAGEMAVSQNATSNETQEYFKSPVEEVLRI